MGTPAQGSAASISLMPDIVIRPLPGPLGAEVECGDIRRLDENARRRIHQAWLDHLVLVFHDQTLSKGDLLEITHIFGEPETAAVAPKDGVFQDVAIISNVLESGKPIGALGAGELLWHSDHSFNEVPLAAAMLYSLETPSEGGDTHFSNMYLALETLPAHLRARVAGLTIKNDGSLNSAGIPRTDAIVTDLLSYEGPSHPIIRTHPETGCNALYLGRRPNAYVNGLSIAESEDLLNQLWAHIKRPEIAFAHKWHPRDLVVWDNRCVMHRRDPFDAHARRVMLRTQCSGDRPSFRAEAVAVHLRAPAVAAS